MRQHQIELLWRPGDGQTYGNGFVDSTFDKSGPRFAIRDEHGNEIRISPKLMYAMFLSLARSYDAGILPTFDFGQVTRPVSALDADSSAPN